MTPLFHVGAASRSSERFFRGLQGLDCLIEVWVLLSQGLNNHSDEDEQLALILTIL